MKNAIKYLVLSISCVICFVVLVLMVALLLDIESLSYPATLILPMISYALFIGGFVMLTIWAFKFSNNKAHKTFLIISLSVFLASAVVFLSAKIVNPIISEEPETECFDFSYPEIISNLKECQIDFSNLLIIDGSETGEKTATYDSISDIFNTDKTNLDESIKYFFSYDDKTDKLTSFFFNINRGSTKVAERYLYHIYSIAEYIEPDINTEDIANTIINELKEDEGAIYEGENFILYAFLNEDNFTAMFKPIKDTKGE